MHRTSNIEIKNRRASFDYELVETFTAGMALTGTEIKAIREGKAALADAYCLFLNGELWARNISISEYRFGSYSNHNAKRDRKLLLQRRELQKLTRKTKEKGLTIVALRIFINEKGIAKLDIALARGKKAYDKRESIKEKDLRRENERGECRM
ncbi:MAG: SsrA-binding protein SmpB [Prevotellaceae bacterium]|jgi:SsrA-binding protein|nr:SsrA-binding protein SmpB [Prevotellaceae bacterium]